MPLVTLLTLPLVVLISRDMAKLHPISAYLRANEMTRAEFARRLNPKCSPGLIYHWINGLVTIPAERAVAIEEATNGAVSRRDLRPDLFT